jgi:hypothetical protein
MATANSQHQPWEESGHARQAATGPAAAPDLPGEALRALADQLTAHGFDVTCPGGEHPWQLHLTNVRGAMCDLRLTATGMVIWQYRPFCGTCPGPAAITAMALAILGEAGTRGRPPLPRRSPGLALKGAVGRALAGRGMAVCVKVTHTDEASYDIRAEIEVTNPGRPERGSVWVADDRTVRWECQVSGPGSGTGGPGAEVIEVTRVIKVIARTIAAALAGHAV